jgi:DNA transformation protein
VTPDDIVELFSDFGPVTVRRMFGGAGIYADGTMFGLVAGGVIYLKTGDSNVAMFEREGLPPFTYERREGERAVMSYRRMPDRLYDDPEELAEWARAALAAARLPRERKRPAKQAKPLRAKQVPAKRASTKNRRGRRIKASE